MYLAVASSETRAQGPSYHHEEQLLQPQLSSIVYNIASVGSQWEWGLECTAGSSAALAESVRGGRGPATSTTHLPALGPVEGSC